VCPSVILGEGVNGRFMTERHVILCKRGNYLVCGV
jgi:hypothetical protein